MIRPYRRAFKPALMVLRGLSLAVLARRPLGAVYRGRGVRIRCPNKLRLLGRFVVEDYAEIQGDSIQGITFGARTSVGSFTLIRPSSYYGGPIGEGLRVGDDSSIGPHGYIGCSGLVTIGRNVMLGPGVYIFAENHVFDDLNTTIKSQGIQRSPVTIEDDCWLGSRCMVLAGVTIGQGSVVAAGSVVTKDVPNFSLVAGSPARVLRHRSKAR